MTRKVLTAGVAIAALFAMGNAYAAPFTVTITNNSQTDGLNLTPLFVAFHNGAFDSFDVGGTASAGVERVAEIGLVDVITAEALAADANAVTGAFGAPEGFAGAPIIEAGETASMTFNLNGADHRFFSFLSMVLPSNDTFIGNSNAAEIFDAAGNFLGDQVFEITGNNIYDAGTEANDLTDGPAFVVGQSGGAGTVTSDVISLSDGIGALAVTLPNGSVLNPLLADFVTDRAGFSLATISISADPVPLPGALPLMASAVIGGGLLRRRQRRQAAAK